MEVFCNNRFIPIAANDYFAIFAKTSDRKNEKDTLHIQFLHPADFRLYCMPAGRRCFGTN